MSLPCKVVFFFYIFFFIQVIDAYLKILCQAETDKGKQIIHIAHDTMTNICTGKYSKMDNFPKILSKVSKY